MEKNSIIITKTGKYLQHNYIYEKDLEKDILVYSKEIFGDGSHYFNIKSQIKSRTGKGTIPDAYAINTKSETLFVIEVELKKHSLKSHIFPQITNFVKALENPATKKPLIGILLNELKNIIIPYNKIEKIVSNWKVLIIIDEITLELLDFLSSLCQYEKRIITIPFQTYIKENPNEKLKIKIKDYKNKSKKIKDIKTIENMDILPKVLFQKNNTLKLNNKEQKIKNMKKLNTDISLNKMPKFEKSLNKTELKKLKIKLNNKSKNNIIFIDSNIEKNYNLSFIYLYYDKDILISKQSYKNIDDTLNLLRKENKFDYYVIYIYNLSKKELLDKNSVNFSNTIIDSINLLIK